MPLTHVKTRFYKMLLLCWIQIVGLLGRHAVTLQLDTIGSLGVTAQRSQFSTVNHLNPLRQYFFLMGETESTWYCGHYWPIVPAPDDRWWRLWSNLWNVNWQGKQKYSEKTCTSATLSTTNPTWREPGSNPGRHGGKPVINLLNYGAALDG
jgi:hypothetical protein